MDATPLLSVSVPIGLPLSKNWTLPTGVPDVAATVAVKVTVSVVSAGFLLEATVVVVACAEIGACTWNWPEVIDDARASVAVSV